MTRSRSRSRPRTLAVATAGALAAPAVDAVSAVATLAALAALGGAGGMNAVSAQEIRGSLFVETRMFPNEPLFSAQSDAVLSPSLGLEPELIWWLGDEGPELRATPMLRLDAHDSSRTRFDVREASALWLRDGWTLLAGVSKVYWGTTESVHLVDIVNQTDAVENIDGEDKLGQPMVNFTLERDWGALDLFVLPFFRERTYPGVEGRLSGAAPIGDEASYESGAGQWHPDFAARWSRAVGDIDMGVGGFYGTSREPYLLPTEVVNGFVLQPYYTIIDQFSVDLQYTRGATLWKLEAMTRGGHGGRFLAAVFGAEHTLFAVGPGPADLGLLAEITLDGRGDDAPYTPFDNDLFIGARWAFNDIQATTFVGGPIIDLEHGETIGFLEAERRIGERWVGSLELRVLFNTDTSAPLHALRRDDFLTFTLSRFF